MPVIIAYIIVVIVWATTPLGLAYSGDTLHPLMGAWARMALGAALGVVLVTVMRVPLPRDRAALKSYGYALFAIYGALSCGYLAAQLVPSGLISVLFGLLPLISAVLGQVILKEAPLALHRWAACLIAFAGLVVIFLEELQVQSTLFEGLLLVLCGVFMMAFSAVMVKKTNAGLHPLAQTVGTLILSQPLFALTWFLVDGQPPTVDWASPSPWAVLYLAVFGSLLGFVCYYYILKKLELSTVALATLITPVFALYLGHVFRDESLSPTLLSGSALILTGLGLFFYGHRLRRLRHE